MFKKITVILKSEASHCCCIISWQRSLWKNREVECVFFLTVENNRTGWGVNLFQDLPAGKLWGDSILPPSDLRHLLMRLCLPRHSTFRAPWVGSDTVYPQQCEVWSAWGRRCHKCTQRFARNKARVWYIQSVYRIAWKKTSLISLKNFKQEGR